VHAAATREEARDALIGRWDRGRIADPGATRIILTHTRDEVQALNGAARDRLRIAGAIGEDVTIATERGPRDFAAGDRIMFLKNERSLGVKNGTLGTVESTSAVRMAVQLDDDRSVAFDIKDYSQIGLRNQAFHPRHRSLRPPSPSETCRCRARFQLVGAFEPRRGQRVLLERREYGRVPERAAQRQGEEIRMRKLHGIGPTRAAAS
jgi:hypothetical protein